MKQAKKMLRDVSVAILIFALLTIVRTVLEIVLGPNIPADQIPEGITKEFVEIVLLIAQIMAVVFVLPQIYIGYKGYKISHGQECTKGPIVWATILLVLSVITLISSVSAVFNPTDIFNNILALIISICDVALYFLYVKYAKQIRNAQ